MRELFAWSFSYESLSIGQASISARTCKYAHTITQVTEITFMFSCDKQNVQIALKIIHHHFQSFITWHEAASVCESKKWTRLLTWWQIYLTQPSSQTKGGHDRNFYRLQQNTMGYNHDYVNVNIHVFKFALNTFILALKE